MQRVWYANAVFLTDDRIADALMDYATVLGVLDSSDVVRIAGLDEDGEVRDIQMVVGPASQILAMATGEVNTVVPATESVVADLRERSRSKLPDPSLSVARAADGHTSEA